LPGFGERKMGGLCRFAPLEGFVSECDLAVLTREIRNSISLNFEFRIFTNAGERF
jgi:hypothetical protein